MIVKKHNDSSRQFMQSLISFIDTVFHTAINANQPEANKVLTDGITNIRDAVFSELVKDKQIELLYAQAQEKQKKENLKDLNPDQKLEKDLGQ